MVMVVRDAETVTAMAGSLRAMLAEVDAGRLEASDRMRARIEGAVVALDVVLGADAATVLERVADPPPDLT